MQSAQPFDELRDFYEFVGEKLSNGSSQIRPEDVLYEWRSDHPSAEELAASTTAVRRALADMAAGDRGEPFDEFNSHIREKYGLPQ